MPLTFAEPPPDIPLCADAEGGSAASVLGRAIVWSRAALRAAQGGP